MLGPFSHRRGGSQLVRWQPLATTGNHWRPGDLLATAGDLLTRSFGETVFISVAWPFHPRTQLDMQITYVGQATNTTHKSSGRQAHVIRAVFCQIPRRRSICNRFRPWHCICVACASRSLRTCCATLRLRRVSAALVESPTERCSMLECHRSHRAQTVHTAWRHRVSVQIES